MADLPSYEIARRALAALIETKGVTMECTPLLGRPDDASDWAKTAVHRQCRVAFPAIAEPLLVSYSAGPGVPLAWAADHGPKDLRRAVSAACERPGWTKLLCFEPLIQRARAAWKPSIVDVLSSCLMDTPEPGQSFEDWADELGYDRDSRKAEKIFHECQRVGAYMRRAFGPDFERAQDLAREM